MSPLQIFGFQVCQKSFYFSGMIDVLIVGKGWTGDYVVKECISNNITYAATTTQGNDGTIEFKFDPSSTDNTPFKRLPDAKTILLTFPLLGAAPVNRFTELYEQVSEKPVKRCVSTVLIP
jgi:hypothetical protein